MKNYILLFLFLCFLNLKLFSQNSFNWNATQVINKDSSVTIKPILLIQLQAKYLQLNTGTTNLAAETVKNITDFSVKRTCYGMSFVSPKFKSNFIIGTGLVSSKANYSIYLYEAWAGMVFFKNHILGFGHNLYNGISRASSISASMILNSDAIGYAFPESGKAALLGRHSSVFVSGNISRLGYRFHISQPYTFAMPELSAEIVNAVDFSTNNLGYEGYVNFYCLDKEDNTNEAKSFSYLGTKKILNFGVGFFYRKKSSLIQNALLEKTFFDKKIFSADLYCDLPLKNGNVFNSYLLFLNSNLGQNYIRTAGGINYLSGGTSLEKSGDADIFAGSGNIFFSQISFLFLNQNILKNTQFFATYCYKDFDLLKKISNQFSVGINHYYNGHKLKVGAEFQTRPCYNADYTFENYKFTTIAYLSFSL